MRWWAVRGLGCRPEVFPELDFEKRTWSSLSYPRSRIAKVLFQLLMATLEVLTRELFGFQLILLVIVPEFLHDLLALRKMTAVIANSSPQIGESTFQLLDHGLML